MHHPKLKIYVMFVWLFLVQMAITPLILADEVVVPTKVTKTCACGPECACGCAQGGVCHCKGLSNENDTKNDANHTNQQSAMPTSKS